MPLKYTSVSSLERLAVGKLAECLWNHKYTRTRTGERFVDGSNMFSVLRNLEDEVLQDLTKLSLPELIHNKVSNVIKSLGVQMATVISLNITFAGFCTLPKEFVLSSQGGLNKDEIARSLVEDETIPAIERFNLACIHCMENSIRTLFIQCNMQHQKTWSEFLNGNRSLVRFWSRFMKKRVNGRCRCPVSGCFDQCIQSLIQRNEAATKYFFHRMSEEEKDKFVKLVASSLGARYVEKEWVFYNTYQNLLIEDYFAGIFSFLFSVIDEKQKMELIIGTSFAVLKCFLVWPYQNLFLNAVEQVRSLVPYNVDIALLSYICARIKHDRTGYDYNKLFWRLWCPISSERKIEIINRCSNSSNSNIFEQFFLRGKTNMDSVFMDINDVEKLNLITSEAGYVICKEIVSRAPRGVRKCEIVKLFIQECASSTESILRLKEAFKGLENRLLDIDRKIYLPGLCEVLDKLLEEYNQLTS